MLLTVVKSEDRQTCAAAAPLPSVLSSNSPYAGVRIDDVYFSDRARHGLLRAVSPCNRLLMLPGELRSVREALEHLKDRCADLLSLWHIRYRRLDAGAASYVLTGIAANNTLFKMTVTFLRKEI